MTTSSTNGTLNGRAPPFGQWERSVAARYLRAKRSQGGVALISIISFIGIMLAVAVLIIVMSVMNGFRAELLSRMLGFSGHLYVTGGVLTDPDREAVIKRISDLPGVVQVTPVVEAQAMALGDITTMDELRTVVRRSEAVSTYEPHHTPEWEATYQKLLSFSK